MDFQSVADDSSMKDWNSRRRLLILNVDKAPAYPFSAPRVNPSLVLRRGTSSWRRLRENSVAKTLVVEIRSLGNGLLPLRDRMRSLRDMTGGIAAMLRREWQFDG